MTPVIYVMLVWQVHFLIWKLVKVLIFAETPATFEQNQNSGLQYSLSVMLMILINHHHL